MNFLYKVAKSEMTVATRLITILVGAYFALYPVFILTQVLSSDEIVASSPGAKIAAAILLYMLIEIFFTCFYFGVGAITWLAVKGFVWAKTGNWKGTDVTYKEILLFPFLFVAGDYICERFHYPTFDRVRNYFKK